MYSYEDRIRAVRLYIKLGYVFHGQGHSDACFPLDGPSSSRQLHFCKVSPKASSVPQGGHQALRLRY